MPETLTIPKKITAMCQANAERVDWLRRLPDVVAMLRQRWGLELGAPFDGDEVSCSWVAPAVCEDGTVAILKLGVPHMEGRDEIKGLRFWDGNGTVRLMEADEAVGAMLLERCEPGTALRELLLEEDQDVVIAGLLRRLRRHVSAEAHGFRPLAEMTAYWRHETLAKAKNWLDAGLVAEGLRLFRELPETAPAEVLLATDLHAGNVLRAEREPWLVIDPKPFVGDPAYDATQHLMNCPERLRAQPVRTMRRFAELAELEYERVRLWTFARVAVQAGEEGAGGRWMEVARGIVKI